MSGCFGSHPVDRWMEKQLDDYLDSTESPDCNCWDGEHHEMDWDEEKDMWVCPHCQHSYDPDDKGDYDPPEKHDDPDYIGY